MWRRTLFAQATVIIVALVVLAWRAWPDGKLHVFFLTTKGDAALIQTPGGGYVLVDGGGDPAALTAALGQHMPFWQRNLDAVVLTQTGGAYVPGQVAALARYRAERALAPAVPRRSATLAEWQRLLRDAHTPIHVAQRDNALNLDGATLRVLSAGTQDQRGLILRLDYGVTSVVFAQASDEDNEASLAASGALAPASLVAYPWQRDAHTAFIAALQPQYLVLTDGYEADKPIEQTFTERAVGGAKLYHERLNGTVEWVSDGRRAWVTTELSVEDE